MVSKRHTRIDADVVVRNCIWRFSWGIAAPNLVIMEDKDCNIITIRSASAFIPGQKWKLSGIVKRENVFKGQRQLHLRNWELTL